MYHWISFKSHKPTEETRLDFLSSRLFIPKSGTRYLFIEVDSLIAGAGRVCL